MSEYTYPVKDERGKIPRFVVCKSFVVNQFTQGRVSYTDDWKPAYIKLLKKYRKDEL